MFTTATKRKFMGAIVITIFMLASVSTYAHDTSTPTPPEGEGTDLTSLPVGDGKYSTTAQVGYIYLCNTTFNDPGGAGAEGPWFNGDGTFDFTAKAVVDGAVTWQNSLTITLNGETRDIVSNDLPDHTTGEFPISSADDAYTYDRNPNAISEQNIVLQLPANPTVATQPTCLSGGAIGILLTGTVIFNGLDAGGRDAVAHETQDSCQGHPQQQGQYHYHNLTTCIEDSAEGHSALLGYAFDGFGIYGVRGEDGEVLTNADLDECHGHTHTIEWDGQSVEMYHYHATYEYPYTLGCFRGTASISQQGQGGMGQMGGQSGQGQPPMGGQTGQGQSGQGQPPMGGQGQDGTMPPPPSGQGGQGGMMPPPPSGQGG